MPQRRKVEDHLRSVWDEWSIPHDYGLWHEHKEPDVIAKAGEAVGMTAPHEPAPEPPRSLGEIPYYPPQNNTTFVHTDAAPHSPPHSPPPRSRAPSRAKSAAGATVSHALSPHRSLNSKLPARAMEVPQAYPNTPPTLQQQRSAARAATPAARAGTPLWRKGARAIGGVLSGAVVAAKHVGGAVGSVGGAALHAVKYVGGAVGGAIHKSSGEAAAEALPPGVSRDKRGNLRENGKFMNKTRADEMRLSYHLSPAKNV